MDLPAAPLAPRMEETAVWTGHQFVVWGGAGQGDGVTYRNGAAYDPAARRWRVLPPGPLGARWGAVGVWTGEDVFIWGGTGPGTGWTGPTFRNGALYDPTTRQWTRVPPAPIPARQDASVIWTGHEVVVFGGLGTGHIGWVPARRTDGAVYNLVTGRWQRLPSSPLPFQAMQVSAAWNGTALVATALGASGVMTVSWSPGSPRWHVLATVSSLARAISSTVVWTGSRFVYLRDTCPIIPGDALCANRPRGSAAAFDPGSGTQSSLPRSPVLGRPGTSTWTGRALVAINPESGSGAAYDAGARRWRRLPTAPPFNPLGVVSVWTGHELIVWGGVYRAPAIAGEALVAR